MGSLLLTDEPSRGTMIYTIEKAKKKGVIISYAPNYQASFWKDKKSAKKQMQSLIPHVDIMKVSDEEMDLFTEYDTPEDAAASLCVKESDIIFSALNIEQVENRLKE